MILCFVLVAAPLKLLLNQVPELYGNLKANEFVYHKDFGNLEKLLSDKKELNRSSETGFTPLMVTAHLGNEKYFEILRQQGASLNGEVNYPKDKFLHQRNLFHLALIGKNPEIVAKLLSEKNLNESINGVSPLHIASWNCSPKIIDLLILKGAHLNARNKKGKTPLHIASENNCLKGAMALLESGADPNLRDESGKLAFDYAKDAGNDLAYYLEKKSRGPAGK
jgi:ankyrin repeat protein